MKMIQVYRAEVLTTLLYGSDTWLTYRSHIRRLERSHQRCLRNILNIRCSNFVTKIEVPEQVKIPNIDAMPLKYQLNWAGHVSRMEDHRLPNVVLYGELFIGHRERGAPLKCYKDRLKKSLIACHVDPLHWSDMAGDRDAWRHSKWSTSLNKTKEMYKKTREAKGSSRGDKHHTGRYFHLWTLLTTLPFPHRTRQS